MIGRERDRKREGEREGERGGRVCVRERERKKAIAVA